MRSRKRWDEDLDEGGIYTYIYSPIMEKNLERKYEVKKTGKAGLYTTLGNMGLILRVSSIRMT